MVRDPDADHEAIAAARKERAESAEEDEEEEESVEEAAERAQAQAGFGAYIPGLGAAVVPDGQSRRIRGDLFKHIAWNLHYQSTGKPETARPQIGAWLADSQSTTVARALHLREYTSENKTLVAPSPIPESERQAPARFRQAGQGLNPLLAPIPANDGNWTVTGIGAFQNDAVIQNLFIHAHVRGKDFTYVLIYPDGREEILLRVPKYSFDWQYTYHLLDPVQAPAGSTIKVVSRYDNSRANRSNPAPHKEAYWWEQSWDDMFLATVGYTLAEEVKPTGATEE